MKTFSSEDLPPILLPKRAQDFYIEGEPGSTAQRQTLHRMSLTELNELQIRLKEFLKKGSFNQLTALGELPCCLEARETVHYDFALSTELSFRLMSRVDTLYQESMTYLKNTELRVSPRSVHESDKTR